MVTPTNEKLLKYSQFIGARIVRGLMTDLSLYPKIHYTSWGIANAPRLTSIILRGMRKTDDIMRVEAHRKQLIAHAGLDSNKDGVRIWYKGMTVFIEVPKTDPELFDSVTVKGLRERRGLRLGHTATVGLKTDSRLALLDFDKPDIVHTFIAGQTQSGKTTTQKVILWCLAHNTKPHKESVFFIFDVAKRGSMWHEFSGLSHLGAPIISDVPMAEGALTWATKQIINRAERKKQGDREYYLPRIFMAIDEVKNLLDWSEICGNRLGEIASVGGQFGIHLILATQYPQVQMLGGEGSNIKGNISTVLCGKVNNASNASNVLGITGSGAQDLAGYGDFLMRTSSEGIDRVATPWLDEDDMQHLPFGNQMTVSFPAPEAHMTPTSSPIAVAKDDIKWPSSKEVALALYSEGQRYNDGTILGQHKLRRLIAEIDDNGECGLTRSNRVRRFASELIDWGRELGLELLYLPRTTRTTTVQRPQRPSRPAKMMS